MVETVSRMRHLTEVIPLNVYNRVFSMPPDPLHNGQGQVVYYDATQDYYGDIPLSRASEVKTPEVGCKTPILRFD